MKNLNAGKFYGQLAAIAVIGLCAGAMLATTITQARAQANGDLVTVQRAIHDLKSRYGIMIIPRNGVDLNARVSASIGQDNYTTPSQAVDRLASAIGARARKVFIVVPASADRPVTTLADARSFEDSDANVTLDLSGVPAEDAIRAVAAADNAAIDLRSDVGRRTVNLTGTNISVANAIAQIAEQTNTHWIEAYELMPMSTGTARAGQFHRSLPLVTMNADQGPTGPVYFHPYVPPAPPQQAAPAQPAPTASDQAASAVANSSPPVDQANATPTVPVNPYNSNYSPYFVMQNGYGYLDGQPYPQTWSGFSNGGFIPGSGLYLLPGFGGFGYPGFGSPLISGGTSVTSGF